MQCAPGPAYVPRAHCMHVLLLTAPVLGEY
jgi:hypothetical protein